MTESIKHIQFLIPAKVQYVVGNNWSYDLVVNVDLKEKQVFDAKGVRWKEDLEKEFFDHIQNSTKAPENLYEASSDVYEQAEAAADELETIKKEKVG